MSKPQRPKYHMSLEPGTGSPIAPEIQPKLKQIILDLALLEDVAGPICSRVDREEYVAEGARRLRESILLLLHAAGTTLTEDQLTNICRDTALETFVIRRLLEAKISGEMCKADIKGNPFYKTYQAYFNQTPEMAARKLFLITEAAAAGERQAKKN